MARRICAMCGQEFEISGNAAQLYCSDKCREFGKVTQRLRIIEREEARKIEKKRAKKRAENETAIKAINRAAAECGMSYGQYVAKYNIK